MDDESVTDVVVQITISILFLTPFSCFPLHLLSCIFYWLESESYLSCVAWTLYMHQLTKLSDGGRKGETAFPMVEE